ncbi:MAG: hypothetical protein U0P45_05810 [Acidimicrobiales bacterium]
MRRASDLEVRIAEVEPPGRPEVEPEAGYGSHGGDEVEGGVVSLESRVNRAEKRVPPRRVRPTVELAENIIDFASNPRFLGIDLYPVQATILKICTGAVELFTGFDRDVLAEWEQGWSLTEHQGKLRYVGSYGTPPGLEARLAACRAAGRNGPAEIALVMGRRGSRGFSVRSWSPICCIGCWPPTGCPMTRDRSDRRRWPST